ncbi:DUF3592 domain-containing protein [Pedobacter sp. UYP1]|uniref:DUF3592 domain-containing protein n=1 Tax=Pedobacter sp. UYP1 TaxID=1756396 RepID=UPI0033977E0A
MYYRITLIFGVILCFASLFILSESLTFLKNSERATGTVTGLELLHDSDGDTYRPVFAIKTKNNQVFIYKHTSSSSPASWKVGENATFVYDPKRPDSARLFTYFGIFSWTIVLLCISIYLMVIGAGYQLSKRFLRKF